MLFTEESEMKNMYQKLGVDANKSAVRKAFKGVVKNDFPGAFVNIVRHRLLIEWVKTQHADGDGSKVIARLLMYFITQDPTWLDGMVDDAFSMNMSDIAAAGFVGGGGGKDFSITDTLNVNCFNVPKDVLTACVSRRLDELCELYYRHGFPPIDFLGGETADLPRQVHSSVFDITVHAMMKEEYVIAGNVQPGDKIWGFASDGQAAWEKSWNSGIMSNGLTLGTTSLVHRAYASEYPQLLLAGNEFKGRFRAGDRDGFIEGVIEALLSPTRQWALLIKILIDRLNVLGKLHWLHGISINTGGGATKCKALGTGGITFEKEMPKPPDIFQLIQRESGETWKNMYETFNCGVGIDVIGSPELGGALRYAEDRTGVQLYSLGQCSASASSKNEVALETPYGQFVF